MVEHIDGHLYAVDISATLMVAGGKIVPISERVLGLDRHRTEFPDELERAYFELVGPYVVPNPILLYGDTNSRSRGQGTQNFFQGDVHMKSRFDAIDQIILDSTEEQLVWGVERKFDPNENRNVGHTKKAYVKLLPESLSGVLIPRLLAVEHAQDEISPELLRIEFTHSPHGYGNSS
jgi:hypothetical protein